MVRIFKNGVDSKLIQKMPQLGPSMSTTETLYTALIGTIFGIMVAYPLQKYLYRKYIRRHLKGKVVILYKDSEPEPRKILPNL